MKKRMEKTLLSAPVLLLLMTVPAQAAGGLTGSALGTGLMDLINDVFTFLTILCPIAGGAMAAYYAIRRSMADEQDGKMWEKRIRTAIFCGVGGCLVSAVTSLLSSYF